MAIVTFLPIERNAALDVNLHDTYVVIAWQWIYLGIAVMLLFCWTAYVIVSKLALSNTLTWVHVIITLVALIYFVVPQSHLWGLSGIPRRYYAFTEFEQRRNPFNAVTVYVVVILAFILAQLVFLVNLSIGLIKKLMEISNRNIIS